MSRNSCKKCLNDVYLLFKNLSQSISNPFIISSARPSINFFELANSPSLFDFIIIGLLSNAPFETQKSILMAQSIDSKDNWSLLPYNQYGKVNYRTADIVHIYFKKFPGLKLWTRIKKKIQFLSSFPNIMRDVEINFILGTCSHIGC